MRYCDPASWHVWGFNGQYIGESKNKPMKIGRLSRLAHPDAMLCPRPSGLCRSERRWDSIGWLTRPGQTGVSSRGGCRNFYPPASFTEIFSTAFSTRRHQALGHPYVLDRPNFQSHTSASRSWWKLIVILGAHPGPPRCCKALVCSPSSRLTVAPDWVS